jgi:hypothetical protein
MKPVERGDEEIGVILVHGIDEQRRFDHLDGQARFLINALSDLSDVDDFTVTINPNAAAGYRAQSDTWAAGPDPSVTICVHHCLDGRPRWTKLQLHEVWWADVNEPYSIAKQFRFWLWALAVWNHQGKRATTLPTANRVVPPVVPHDRPLWDRLRLFALSSFFSILGMSLGLVTFLVTRLFNIDTPQFLQILTNYVSAIKLYNQRRRFGPGLWWGREEFLDATNEPPRVSIRRRMIRGIADVACKRYNRWYIMAHSLGSVVAFNGLMETAYAWPGYLDDARWDLLKRGEFAGPAAGDFKPTHEPTMPPRPAWVHGNEIAYRARIFEQFGGILTYGSPLEKFAGLWPALVPISREPAFRADVTWVNLLDPIDPISGKLLAFGKQPQECCPPPQNIGYCASWWLLLAHIKYLAHRKPRPDAALATLRWILTGDQRDFHSEHYGNRTGKWIAPGSLSYLPRTLLAWLSWGLFTGALACLAALIIPILFEESGKALHALSMTVHRLSGIEHRFGFDWTGPKSAFLGIREWLDRVWHGYWSRVSLLLAGGVLTTLIFGVTARVLPIFQRDADDTQSPIRRRDPRTPQPAQPAPWALPSQEPPIPAKKSEAA